MRRPAHAMMIMVVAAPVLLTAVVPASAVPGPAPEGAAAAPQYEVAAVISDGDRSPIGRGLNETGTIAGYTGYPYTKAFVWDSASGLTTLPGLPGDTRRFAFDVNDAETVVGHSGYESIEPPQRAVRWVGRVPENLGVLPGGTDSHAEAINEAGTIVGWSNSSSGNHAFVWTEAGGMVDITPSAPPSQIAYAYDVNEADQVTGHVGSRAFVWDDGVLTDLGVPPGYAFSFAYAINDAGVVAGHVTTASGSAERIARWTPGIGWEVLGGVGDLNLSWGINNDGTIVGEGRPSAGIERGFVYLEGVGLRSLSDLLTTNVWTILYAFDVDDAGRIVAYGSNRQTGDGATLLLVPVRPPMHEDGLRVLLRGSPDPTSALAKLRVVDESGAPVSRATVHGSWSRNGDVIIGDTKDRTDPDGRAKLSYGFGAVFSGETFEFCVTKITHAAYDYDVPPEPSCASVTVPG